MVHELVAFDEVFDGALFLFEFLEQLEFLLDGNFGLGGGFADLRDVLKGGVIAAFGGLGLKAGL